MNNITHYILVIDTDNFKYESCFVSNRRNSTHEILERYRHYNGFVLNDFYIPDNSIYAVKTYTKMNGEK